MRIYRPAARLKLTGRCKWLCVGCARWVSCVRLFATPWAAARQAPLSMRFSRQEYWSGLPCPPPGELPNPGIKPLSLKFLASAGRFFTTELPGKPKGTTLEKRKPLQNTWNHLPSSWLVTFGFARDQCLLLKNYPTRRLQLVVAHYVTSISRTFPLLYIDF